ncbi:hypothetical protein CD943_04470 [Brevundimonas diminuta]|uniref:Uncharacterized protein n=1 Tax=Brevundimonas diminuta TaxID=293 RepID=A0A1Z3LVM4_BREDI|nr:hypothetical protein CD943_04470 [Brevundimonas diminuta]
MKTAAQFHSPVAGDRLHEACVVPGLRVRFSGVIQSVPDGAEEDFVVRADRSGFAQQRAALFIEHEVAVGIQSQESREGFRRDPVGQRGAGQTCLGSLYHRVEGHGALSIEGLSLLRQSRPDRGLRRCQRVDGDHEQLSL